MNWRKSSRCESSTCVEVSLPQWRRPEGCESGNCVEVLIGPPGRHVLVRDTANNVVRYTPDEWAAFIAGIKAGEFDLP